MSNEDRGLGRKPDYYLSLKTESGKSARIGAAWHDPKGHMNVQLNPGTVMSWRDLADGCLLTLFPNDSK